MKFNLKKCQIEVEPHPSSPGMFRVTNGCEFVENNAVVSLDYLKEHFTPCDGAALDLVEPDRVERICNYNPCDPLDDSKNI